jgi:lysine 2,3-aminomutase
VTTQSVGKRRRTLRDPRALAEAGLIAQDDIEDIAQVAEVQAIAITPEMVDRIDRSRPDDPVVRQFVPDRRELTILEEETPDPIGDEPYMPVKGITHRYRDRLLLLTNYHCAVYCRFCFRREKVGPGEEFLRPDELEKALDYIRAQPDLHEVILTGGDPLMLPARRIRYIIEQLSELDDLDVIRFHTRIPVVAPELITTAMLEAFDSTDKIICVVVHANHASEFGDAARAMIKQLRKRGIMLVSHSVLLKGVNDTPEAMTDLMREFVRNGIKPYYLHHCDLAEGVSHFRTNFDEGQALMRALRGHVSGLAQPQYVLHIPGGYGKVPIGPSYIDREDDAWVITDYLEGRHRYPIAPDGSHAVESSEEPVP